MDLNNSFNITESLIEDNDEPPLEHTNICNNWIGRMVACFTQNLSLCEAGTYFAGNNGFHRKLSRVGRFTKFY